MFLPTLTQEQDNIAVNSKSKYKINANVVVLNMSTTPTMPLIVGDHLYIFILENRREFHILNCGLR